MLSFEYFCYEKKGRYWCLTLLTVYFHCFSNSSYRHLHECYFFICFSFRRSGRGLGYDLVLSQRSYLRLFHNRNQGTVDCNRFFSYSNNKKSILKKKKSFDQFKVNPNGKYNFQTIFVSVMNVVAGAWPCLTLLAKVVRIFCIIF